MSGANISCITGERKNDTHTKINRKSNTTDVISLALIYGLHTLGLQHKQTLNNPFIPSQLSSEVENESHGAQSVKEYRNKSFDFIFTGVDDLLGNSFMSIKNQINEDQKSNKTN